MNVPNKIKALYKHWQSHTSLGVKKARVVGVNDDLLEKMLSFASERMKIWEKKYLQANPPFTRDPILRKYRFCNIYRELDRQTIDIHSHLKDQEQDFRLWLLNIAFQRFVCRPSTIFEIGNLSFAKKNNEGVYKRLIRLDKPKYGNAYVFPISTIQKSDYPTREEFFCFYLPTVMSDIASSIQDFKEVTVDSALKTILPNFGFNFMFHWTEILIDVAYQFPDKINLYKDFPIGPGALPTMKSLNSKANPIDVCNSCVLYQTKKFPHLEYKGKKVLLSAENWEGIACEFRKYTNLKSGNGRVRIYSD